MHRVHPFLQTDAVLGNLLYALVLGQIRRLNAQRNGQFGPCLNLPAVEAPHQLEDDKGAEALAAALGRVRKGLSQAVGVCVWRQRRIAVEDEAHVGVLDGVGRHVAIGQCGRQGGLARVCDGEAAATRLQRRRHGLR